MVRAFMPLGVIEEGGGQPMDTAGHPPYQQQQQETAFTPEQLLQQALDRLTALEHQRDAQYNTHHAKEPKINSPEPFRGSRDQSLEFLLKCQAVFTTQPRTYYNDITKLAYAINLLQGDAYQWIKPILLALPEDQPTWFHTWEGFYHQLSTDFGDSDIVETSRQKLKGIKQTSSATIYATEFRKHSLYLHWGDEAFRHTYFDGLKEDVKDKLLSPNKFKDLNTLIKDSIEWDNLLFQRRRTASVIRSAVTVNQTRVTQVANRVLPSQSRAFNNYRQSTSVGTPSTYNRAAPVNYSRNYDSSSGPTPMDIDSIQQPRGPLTQQERDHRIKNQLCLYCAKPGHIASECRAKKNGFKVAKLEASQENGIPQQ
jgi:hypothetical protein